MPSHNDNFTDRQRQILDATLDLVATEGLLHTSMSKITNRSACSPGIVYHYFANKDDILDILFISVFGRMMASIFDDQATQLPVRERYKTLWLRKYHYHLSHPTETSYMEQYKHSALFTTEKMQETQELMAELLAMGQNDIDQGLVIDLPLDVIYTMTLTVALNLAKAHIETGQILDADTLETIAERVCGGVIL